MALRAVDQILGPLTYISVFTDVIKRAETILSLPFPEEPYYDRVASGKDVTGHDQQGCCKR
jgi:hypothetical protein